MTLPAQIYLDASPVERVIPIYPDPGDDEGPTNYEPVLSDDVPEVLAAAVTEIAVVEHDIRCADCAVESPASLGCLIGAMLDGDADELVRWWPVLVTVDADGRIVYRCEDHALGAEDSGRCVSCTGHHHQGCYGAEITDGGPCRCACRSAAQRQAVPT